MSDEYRFYGVQHSYYSARVRACLQYKRLPYVETPVNPQTVEEVIVPLTGSHYVPVVICPGGRVLKDGCDIVEALDERHPDRRVSVTDPVLAVVAAAFEFLADELLVMAAGHYRWTPKRTREWGFRMFREIMPLGIRDPRYVSFAIIGAKQAAESISARLSENRIDDPESQRAFVELTEGMCDRFDAHLRDWPFLLGDRFTAADLSMMNALFAHLYRDPGDSSEYIKWHCIRLMNWIDRVHAAAGIPEEGEPQLTDTLQELLGWLGRASSDFANKVLDAADATLMGVAAERSFPPSSAGAADDMGRLSCTLLGATLERPASIYTAWKLQKLQDCYRAVPTARRPEAHTFADKIGLLDVCRRTHPWRLEKSGFDLRVVPARRSAQDSTRATQANPEDSTVS